MTHPYRYLSALIILLIISPVNSGIAKQKVVTLGNFPLENGSVIENCRIGYRRYGILNASGTNAILIPTWFNGTSGHAANFIGPGKLADSTKYHIIIVDALGNGISASPSNSPTQPEGSFPVITIRDMVESQHSLLKDILGIRQLYAMIGGSMGGMQVFEWLVSHPNFMKKAVAYVSSPQPGSYDLLRLNVQLSVIQMGQSYQCHQDSIARVIAMLNLMNAHTPEFRTRETKRDAFSRFEHDYYHNFKNSFNLFNWASQLQAIIGHDISRKFNGSIERAASQVKSDVLIIVSAKDHMVNPQPALDFADKIGAETLILDSDRGHLAISAELPLISKKISRFLDQ